MFENLIKLLGDNSAAIAEVTKIQANYNSLSTEVETLESKLSDSIVKRDKYKTFVRSTKAKLGIAEGEDLNDETLTAKIANLSTVEVDEVSKLEVAKLEKSITDLTAGYEGKLKDASTNALNTQLEIELYKTTAGINSVNTTAQTMIINQLKEGATFEDGKIVYKANDGTTVRKDGIALTLSSKLDSIKNSEETKFLFKSEAKSGSGMGKSGSGESNSLSPFAKTQRERAIKVGIKPNH